MLSKKIRCIKYLTISIFSIFFAACAIPSLIADVNDLNIEKPLQSYLTQSINSIVINGYIDRYTIFDVYHSYWEIYAKFSGQKILPACTMFLDRFQNLSRNDSPK